MLNAGTDLLHCTACAGMLQPGSPLQTQAPHLAPENAEAPAPGPAALSLYSQQHVEASSSGLGHGAAAGVAGKPLHPVIHLCVTYKVGANSSSV